MMSNFQIIYNLNCIKHYLICKFILFQFIPQKMTKNAYFSYFNYKIRGLNESELKFLFQIKSNSEHINFRQKDICCKLKYELK